MILDFTPDFTSPAWWSTIITQAVSAAIAVIALFHKMPGLPPEFQQTVVPAVSVLAAAVAQAVYSHGHHRVVAAKVAAAAAVPVGSEPVPTTA